jgi:hypothetical protein
MPVEELLDGLPVAVRMGIASISTSSSFPLSFYLHIGLPRSVLLQNWKNKILPVHNMLFPFHISV